MILCFKPIQLHTYTVRTELPSPANPNQGSHGIRIGAIIGISLAVLAIFILIMGLLLLYRKFVKLDRPISLLTYEEVRHFREGQKPGFVTGQIEDSACLVDFLPYNDKYELPRKHIFLGKNTYPRITSHHSAIDLYVLTLRRIRGAGFRGIRFSSERYGHTKRRGEKDSSRHQDRKSKCRNWALQGFALGAKDFGLFGLQREPCQSMWGMDGKH